MIKIITKDKIEKELSRLLRKMSFDRMLSSESVRDIIEDVVVDGDKALLKYTKRFDRISMGAGDIMVLPSEIEAAYNEVDRKFLSALKVAIGNIRSFHEKQKEDQWFDTRPHDAIVGQRAIPVERVGIYVPGGRAPYPSSVLMNAIPAAIAGAEKIVMVTPPVRHGKKAGVNPHVLVAAAEAGVSSIYKVGGAQAIAALAFGTETVPKVDMIVGPGNIYVTLAKKMVYGSEGIDKLAGPSDIVVIADEDSYPSFIAADMLSQAEHDPNSSAILITTSERTALSVRDEIKKQVGKLGRAKVIARALKENSAVFVVENLKEAAELSNRIAPEHLEIMSSSPQKVLEMIKNAGAVFLGPYSPVVVGDYIAGPNHVLPTGGASRFSSALGVYDFTRKQSIIGYNKQALMEVRDDLKVLTAVEGLDAHSRAVDVRFE